MLNICKVPFSFSLFDSKGGLVYLCVRLFALNDRSYSKNVLPLHFLLISEGSMTKWLRAKILKSYRRG